MLLSGADAGRTGPADADVSILVLVDVAQWHSIRTRGQCHGQV